jgi:lipopolysaccharide export system protein LptC
MRVTSVVLLCLLIAIAFAVVFVQAETNKAQTAVVVNDDHVDYSKKVIHGEVYTAEEYQKLKNVLKAVEKIRDPIISKNLKKLFKEETKSSD